MILHKVNQRQLNIIGSVKKFKCCTSEELATLLGVSIRTIRHDIAYLKKIYPDNLVVRPGRYNGGIEWKE